MAAVNRAAPQRRSGSVLLTVNSLREEEEDGQKKGHAGFLVIQPLGHMEHNRCSRQEKDELESPFLPFENIDGRNDQREADEQRQRPGKVDEFKREDVAKNRVPFGQAGIDDGNEVDHSAAERDQGDERDQNGLFLHIRLQCRNSFAFVQGPVRPGARRPNEASSTTSTRSPPAGGVKERDPRLSKPPADRDVPV